MDGWWTTPNLQDLMDVILMNNENIARSFPGAGLFRLRERLRHCLNVNSRRGSQRNVAHHYDLGNDFYALWLDETMTYSSALFRDAGESLAEAQRNKYAAICDQLAPAPGDRILEIGCGWGGFAEYAIRERHVTVTGLTVSREQRDYARKRLFEAGLAERAEILLRDYREEHGVYDGIASIEMVEAVGEKYWAGLFQGAPRPAAAQAASRRSRAITIAGPSSLRSTAPGPTSSRSTSFPGGMLPSPTVPVQPDRGSRPRDGRQDDLRRQLLAYPAHLAPAVSMPDGAGSPPLASTNAFRRMWNFYLAASAAGFAAGTTDVVQIACRRAIPVKTVSRPPRESRRAGPRFLCSRESAGHAEPLRSTVCLRR